MSKKKNRGRKIASSVLASALIFSNLGYTASATTSVPTDLASKISQIKELKAKEFTKIDVKDTTLKATLNPTDTVRVIVELEGQTPVEHATEQGVLYKELSKNVKESLTAKIQKQQKSIKDKIKSKNVKISQKLSFTTAFNGFSGEVKFEDVATIEAIDGVKNVYLANEYNRPEERPDMKTSHSFIQSNATWADAGYEGEGMVVAVIDTGVDPSHKDFNLDDILKADLSKNDVDTLVSEQDLKGKFFTDKVPYGYNYYDQNQTILDLGPDASMHGMHVAGTVAANGDEATGGIKGVAPEAQVLGMKVFSNDPNYPSTWSDVYLAAIDESIKLGADVLNMSLGSTASFYDERSAEDLAITRAVENGVVASVSAGNSAHFGNGWSDTFSKNPDIGVVGAPGLNKDTIQVAASGNVAYLYEHTVTITGNDSFASVGYGIDDWTKLQAPIELISLEGKMGRPADYNGVDVTGKVVLVPRGALSFFDKTQNAAAAGAVGIIVYNSTSPVFYKNQGGWDIPFMKISRQEGLALEASLDAGPVTLDFTQTVAQQDPEMGRMTGFTSWGTTPSLELKPEITAPGGKIYSTLQNDAYGVMSGTSMAAPHVSGGAALVQQYLQEDTRFGELSVSDRTDLAKVLLMNTSEVIIDLNDQPFSPRRQGAGMMQTYSAVTTPVYVVNKETNEAKVELKDFTETKFDMTFTATNVSSEDATYTVNTDVLTDMFYQGADGLDYNPRIAGDLDSALVDAPKTITVPAGESLDFTVSVDFTNAKIVGEDVDGNPIVSDLKEDIFIEGFVRLDAAAGEADLTIPYLGFYGNWDRPEIVDGFKVLGEDRFYELNSGWQEMLFGDGNFVAPVTNEAGQTFYPVSPNGDGAFDDIYPLPAFLRNADEVQFNVLDENNKFLRRVLLETDVRKNYYDAGASDYYSFSSARAWDGKVKSQTVADGLYYYEMKSVVDYDGAAWQSKKLPVYIDTTAPSVTATFDPETQVVSWETVETGTGVSDYFVFVDGVNVGSTTADVKQFTLTSVPAQALVEVFAIDNASNVGNGKAVIGDNELPLIFLGLSTPEPYGAYNEKSVPVEGYVTDDFKLDTLTVNGTTVEFTLDATTGQYNFATTAEFDADGKYDVIVTATDLSGKVFSISRKVFIDTTAPGIVVDAPATVEKSVEEVTVTLNLTDNYNYLSLYVDDNHEFVQPFLSPVDIMTPADTNYEVTLPLNYGDNTLSLRLLDIAGNEVTKEVTVYRDQHTSRIAGETLYDTSAMISSDGWESSDVVVLARGDHYVDALSGVPLAAKHNAPLLLTEKANLDASISAEIARLGAKKVYILGGELAITPAVVAQLKAINSGIEIVRLAGATEYDTAVAIANEVAPTGSKKAVVVSAEMFHDALSVASYAGAEGLPILLVNSNEAPKATKDALAKLGVEETIVIGGEMIIPNTVVKDFPSVTRLAGETEFDTNIEVIKHFAKGSTKMYLSTSKNFPDALSGGALAAKSNTGILLVGDSLHTSTEEYLKASNIEFVEGFGGELAVNPVILAKIEALLK
ncbi:cell wall-binding repeat-containing protein [Bacillus sp. DJP31]|uniref:cell wall-binding repeat-containing protein n=1 Tax=Bacillus sp. DJP31 TaxID=3409789 RepID=UPI003BB77E27